MPKATYLEISLRIGEEKRIARKNTKISMMCTFIIFFKKQGACTQVYIYICNIFIPQIKEIYQYAYGTAQRKLDTLGQSTCNLLAESTQFYQSVLACVGIKI